MVANTANRDPPLRAPDSGKIVSAEEAVRLIHDGDTIATGGFVGIGFAEEIAVALEAALPLGGSFCCFTTSRGT